MSDRPTNAVSHLGRYAILGRIASGGMATVYLARLADAPGGFSREFALKVIHPHLVEEDGYSARLLQEARLASRVRHPNVVRTIDAGEDQGYAFMALELIDGVNLRQLALHRARPFAIPHATAMVAMVARGLEAIHTATDAEDKPLAMVHRDISPHNVMLDRTGRALLIDLGLAKPEQRTGLTQVGVLAGKLPYMSPEQARVQPLDARSDIFALGTLLFELTTGELPFGETHSATTMAAIVACDASTLEQKLQDASVPTGLCDVILACLRREPQDRIQSAAAVAEALTQELTAMGQDEAAVKRSLVSLVEEAYDTLGVIEHAEPLPRIGTASRPDSIASEPAVRQRGAALRWGAACAIAVVGLAAGGWFLSQSASPQAAVPSQPRSLGAMSEDQAAPPEPTAPVHTQEPPRPVAAPPPTVPPEPEPADEASPAAPALKSQPKAKKVRADAPTLKPNPYTTP